MIFLGLEQHRGGIVSCLRIGWECSVESGALNPDSSALAINVKQWIHWAYIVLDTVERNTAYFVNKE